MYYCLEQDQHSVESILKKYFRLDYDLEALYSEWSSRDQNFSRHASIIIGVRLLDQPLYESLLSFICSQNNAISRITSMVRTLKEKYGRRMIVIDGRTAVYSFPEPEDLSEVRVTEELKMAGFGYRAAYVQSVSVSYRDLGLEGLRGEAYETAWRKLQELDGVGPKVADCIALTGLGKMLAVPIDTHIWRIARTRYQGMPNHTKSLTLSTYCAIGDRFRSILGSTAGWAHLV